MAAAAISEKTKKTRDAMVAVDIVWEGVAQFGSIAV
jgi:hypothetical protein